MASAFEPVWIWGLPLAPWTTAQVLERLDSLIQERIPKYFITANLHYAMISHNNPELEKINDSADFIIADGMPLVWWSKLRKTRLPERVAGSDLIYKIAQQAAEKGYRIFLLGGAPGIAESAAEVLKTRYPGCPIVGVECPPFRQLSEFEEQQMLERIRETKPDILMVAFGQPKGEVWIAKHLAALGIPVMVQVGASFDFVAGKVSRAPRWIQKSGFEWVYRLIQEPKRLLPRYVRNALFLLRMITLGSKRKGPAKS